MSQFSDVAGLQAHYMSVRHATEALCEPLEPEDFVIQSMPNASPAKWHQAHTTWFFETFVLARFIADYRPYHPDFCFLFNSYYNAIGPQWPRGERGLLSRPTTAEVLRYRRFTDEKLAEIIYKLDGGSLETAASIVLLGIHHEQQHQELILTDLKHAWAANPLRPIYRQAIPDHGPAPAAAWRSLPGGLVSMGHTGHGFAFDNELPRHNTFLRPFQMASNLVTNADYLGFMQDGGYQQAELWLSDGWAARQAGDWDAPLYWQRRNGHWYQFTLGGLRPVQPAEPVCHVSYYEADAFARWAGARLPTEAEWETAATGAPVMGHFQESGRFHPAATPAPEDEGLFRQLYGDVWQWTASPYLPYPGFAPAAGALGEYNGKFMCNQLVLRGASCVTPRRHARRTYRNFFPADARWQFSGIRLAREPQ